MKIPSLHYSRARDIIKSGDILLCSGNMFFSKLIKFATKSEWSHVGFILRVDQIDRIMVMESVESIGVRAAPLSAYTSNYNGSKKPYDGRMMILRHKNWQYADMHHLSRHAVDLLTHQYNWKEIAGIAFKIMFNRNRNKCNMPYKANEFICSQYAYDCLSSVGLKIPTSCGYVAPVDFYNSDYVSPVCELIV